MKENILVSIIVPIYNVSSFLCDCIEHVCSQTYSKWELLLIDDGSKDDSLLICQEYALQDERIKVFHKANSGVSDTRNFGLEICSGDFVIFLDADDYWNDTSFLSQMVTTLSENKVDICCGDYKEVDSNGIDIGAYNRINKNKVSNINIIGPVDFLTQVLNGDFFLWRCLFRRSLIGNMRFNVKRIFLEDAEFFLRLFLMPTIKCVYLPLTFYSYRKHEGAVTVKSVPNHNKLRDGFDFTRLCFALAETTVDTRMMSYLLKQGLENYLFDVSVIGESKIVYEERKHWLTLWNVSDLHREIKQVVKKYRLFFKYIIVLFPLEQQLKYYRYRLHTKLFIKKIINKILKLKWRKSRLQ